MLSKFLEKKGELTKNTSEGVVHEALEKELFSTLTPTNIMDVSGKNIMTYTIPQRNSTGYSRITHKHILKICREVIRRT